MFRFHARRMDLRHTLRTMLLVNSFFFYIQHCFQSINTASIKLSWQRQGMKIMSMDVKCTIHCRSLITMHALGYHAMFSIYRCCTGNIAHLLLQQKKFESFELCFIQYIVRLHIQTLASYLTVGP